LHLASLISERLGLASRAVTFAERSAKLLEFAYEKSEDAKTARRYAITHSTLGRILLSDGAYDKACESFDTVLGLVEKVEDAEGSDPEAVRLRSQAHLGSGLAKLLSGEVETAISILETGLEEITDSSSFVQTQFTVLIAQTMWMLGTEEAHDAAESLLLERYGTRSAL
jgi:superkiller protein 3